MVQRSNGGRLLRVGCGLVAALVAVCSGCAGSVYGGIVLYVKRLPFYAEAYGIAAEHPDVGIAMGRPVDDGWLVLGTVSTSGESGEADLRVPLSGPTGEGTLRIGAEKVDGRWRYRDLRVEVGDQDIDLLAEMRTAQVRRADEEVWDLVGQGDAAAGQGRLEEAIGYYDRALAAQPDSRAARYRRGKALYELGRLGEAEEDLTRVTGDDEEGLGAWLRLGAIYEQTGRPEPCIDANTQVLRVDSEEASAWYVRALCYRAQGDIPRARAGAREACSRGSADGCEMMRRMGR